MEHIEEEMIEIFELIVKYEGNCSKFLKTESTNDPVCRMCGKYMCDNNLWAEGSSKVESAKYYLKKIKLQAIEDIEKL